MTGLLRYWLLLDTVEPQTRLPYVMTYGLITLWIRCMMSGYWPSFFLRRVTAKFHNNSYKTRSISSHLDLLDQICKGFRHDMDRHFSVGILRAIPSGQSWTNLPVWEARHSTGFDSSFPLADHLVIVPYPGIFICSCALEVTVSKHRNCHTQTVPDVRGPLSHPTVT